MREIIIENNIDIILVDYLQLLPDNAITILKEISHAKNIPIIVGYQLFSGNKQDISTVDLSKFENQNKNAILTTNVSDILGFMYCEPSTERKLIILKNNYGELKDIILN